MEGRSKRVRERRKARLLYEKKKKQTKPKKTIVGRLSGLLAHFIMPLAWTIFSIKLTSQVIILLKLLKSLGPTLAFSLKYFCFKIY